MAWNQQDEDYKRGDQDGSKGGFVEDAVLLANPFVSEAYVKGYQHGEQQRANRSHKEARRDSDSASSSDSSGGAGATDIDHGAESSYPMSGGGSASTSFDTEDVWIALGALLAFALLVGGGIWAVRSFFSFLDHLTANSQASSYKPQNLPSITSGPSGTTLWFGPEGGAVQAYNDGLHFYQAGNYQEAIRYLDEAIRQKPDLRYAYNVRGISYRALGNAQRAVQDLSEAIRLKPDEAWAYMQRGVAYDDLGQYQSAFDDCNQAIRLNREDEFVYGCRAGALARLGRYQEAIADYNFAIHLNPSSTDNYFNRAVAYFNLGQFQQAAADLTESVRLRPDNAAAYYLRSMTYQNLSRWENAVEDFKQGEAHFQQADQFASELRTKALANLGARLAPTPAAAALDTGTSGQDDSCRGEVFRIGDGVSAPVVVNKVDPAYPEEARAAKLEGTVVLSLIVDENGVPRNVHVVRAVCPALDERAVETVRKWLFRPARRTDDRWP